MLLFLPFFGTSDQPCWLAEACKILLPLLQVLTTKQWATVVVHSYPYLPTVEDSLGAFAEQMQGQSKEAIIATAETNSMEREWQALQEYIELIGRADSTHNYLPLSKCSSFKSTARADARAHAMMPFRAEAAINLHYRL